MIAISLALLSCLGTQNSTNLPEAQTREIVLGALRTAIGKNIIELRKALNLESSQKFRDGKRPKERNVDTGTTVVVEKTEYLVGRIACSLTHIEGRMLGGEAYTYKTTLTTDEQDGEYIYSLTVVTIAGIIQHLSLSFSSETRLRTSIYDKDGTFPAFDNYDTGRLFELEIAARELFSGNDLRGKCSSPVTVADMHTAFSGAGISVYGTYKYDKPWPFNPSVVAFGKVDVSKEVNGLKSTHPASVVGLVAATFPYDFVGRPGQRIEFKATGEPAKRVMSLPVVRISLNDPEDADYKASSGVLNRRGEELRPWVFSGK